MTKLGLTPKQQAFAHAYMELGQGAPAARKAGYAPKNARNQASALLKLPCVQGEIARLKAELRPALEAATACTLKSLMLEAEECRRMSMQIKSGSGAIAAVALKAKLAGLLSDRIVDVVEQQRLDEARAQSGEVRTAAMLLRDAALSLDLPPHASAGEIVAAIAGRSIPTPESYLLLHGDSQEADDGSPSH
jgi:phage terminase small subunit